MRNLLPFIGITAAALLFSNRAMANQTFPKTSQRGIDLIKKWEGFEARPYLDIAGHKTIGYGTLLRPGHPLYNVDRITEQQAENLLINQLREDFEPAIERNVTVSLTQNMRDALASWLYNLGETNFRNSTLLRLLNEGDYMGAADQFPVWNKARIGGVLKEVQGLTNRRYDERALFLA